MVDHPLALPADLAGFPGAPFSDEVVSAASSAVRREAGWHIAPVLTETVTLDCAGGPVLLLPTLRLVSVSEVRDVTGDAPVVLTDWRMSKAGMLSRYRWPQGFSAVEVDLVHGYDECPPELFPLIAERAQRRVRQQSTGPFSVTYETDSAAGVLARFTLPSRS